MSTKLHQIVVNNLVVDVVRKDINNLHLRVYPPNGRVRVAAPLRVDDEAVRLFTLTKFHWIKRQQPRFDEQERQSAREFVSGESHCFRGNRYLLDVVYRDAPPRVVLRNNTVMELAVRPGSDVAQRERVLRAWYRHELKQAIPPLIAKWEPIMGVAVAEWGVRQMKTRWGTCSIAARRISFNLELAKKSTQCLEYIVVHEMVHLLERLHSDRFIRFMNQFMPQWQLHRAELNRAPLGDERWDY